jgi:hypothetical protein
MMQLTSRAIRRMPWDGDGDNDDDDRDSVRNLGMVRSR